MTVRILFLIECGPLLGMGHLSRAQVLAEALAARGADVRFALTTPDCLSRVRGFPAAMADAPAPCDILIVDGYRIAAGTIAPFAARAGFAALVDDTADRPRPGDLVVNFQLYADSCDYSAYPARRRLLGPAYAPIRPGFATLRADHARAEPRALLCFGGGATGALGLEAARALAARFAGPIDVALGAMAGPAQDGGALPANVAAHREADMLALMRRATLYAGTLGTSFLEALAAGLPCIGAVAAPDQAQAAEAARGLGVPVLDAPDPERIAAAAAAALAAPPVQAPPPFPDGRGAARLAEALLEMAAPGADSA